MEGEAFLASANQASNLGVGRQFALVVGCFPLPHKWRKEVIYLAKIKIWIPTSANVGCWLIQKHTLLGNGSTIYINLINTYTNSLNTHFYGILSHKWWGLNLRIWRHIKLLILIESLSYKAIDQQCIAKMTNDKVNNLNNKTKRWFIFNKKIFWRAIHVLWAYRVIKHPPNRWAFTLGPYHS